MRVIVAVANYLCWVDNDSVLNILDTRKLNFRQDLTLRWDAKDPDPSILRQIKFDNKKSGFFSAKASHFTLDACSVNFALNANPSQEVTTEFLTNMSCHL